MKRRVLSNTKRVKVTYTNPIGMQVSVKKTMTDDEIREMLLEGKVTLEKIIG